MCGSDCELRAAPSARWSFSRTRTRRPVIGGERLAVRAVPRPVALALAVARADPEAAAAAFGAVGGAKDQVDRWIRRELERAFGA